MNYKKIYLFGADHSWVRDVIVGDDNDLYIKHAHFYSKEDKPVVTKILNPVTKSSVRIVNFLESCIKAFSAYYILGRYAQKKHAKIYNATEGSFIDAFERSKPF